nr:YlxR family protein [Thermoanaerobacterales bacterium]
MPWPTRLRPVPTGPTTRAEAIGEPIRTCIGCRRRRPQSELVRFVRGPDGNPVEGRTLPGRGAWLCRDTLDACRASAVRRKAFT